MGAPSRLRPFGNGPRRTVTSANVLIEATSGIQPRSRMTNPAADTAIGMPRRTTARPTWPVTSSSHGRLVPLPFGRTQRETLYGDTKTRAKRKGPGGEPSAAALAALRPLPSLRTLCQVARASHRWAGLTVDLPAEGGASMVAVPSLYAPTGAGSAERDRSQQGCGTPVPGVLGLGRAAAARSREDAGAAGDCPCRRQRKWVAERPQRAGRQCRLTWEANNAGLG